MSRPSSPKAKELFLDALERPGAERAGFLAAACGDDAALRAQVDALLAAHQAGGRLEAWASPPDPAAPPPPAPTRLGELELQGELGHGAAGVVYRARQKGLDREVAVKILRTGRLARDDELRRFRREAEAAARLDHPNVVTVFESGEDDGHPWFTMKLVDGPSLDRVIERFAGKPREAARLVAKVARAIHHAHQRGLLHRDLKPSNILLDRAGEPYVADFGIAHVAEDDRITGSGDLCGTPAYMSPEQADGGDVTVASDVWSLGCVLHELVTGAAPFSGGSVAETLQRVRFGEPPPLGVAHRADRDLGAIVRTCLMKAPAARYPSAAALADDLERWLDHLPITARPATRAEKLRLLWRRSPVAAALALAVAALLIVVAVGATIASVLLSDRLRGSLIAQASALRLGDAAGRVERGLELLAQAAAIAAGPDVRDEAITTLTQLDLVPESSVAAAITDVRVAATDPELRRAATVGADGRVDVYDLDAGAKLASIATSGDAIGFVSFEPGGRRLWLERVGDGGRPPRLERYEVDLASPRLVLTREIAARPPVFDSAGRRAAIGRYDGAIELVAPPDWTPVLEVRAGGTPNRLAFRHDGRQLAVTSRGQTRVVIVDADTGEIVATLDHPDEVTPVAWDPAGASLLVGGRDDCAYWWDAAGWRLQRTLHGHQSLVARVALLAGGLAVTHGWDQQTFFWRIPTAEVLLRSRDLLIAADERGERVVTQSAERVTRSRLERERVLRVQRAHRGRGPTEACESSDGRFRASAGEHEWMLRDAGGRVLDTRPLEDGLAVEFDPRGGAVFVASRAGVQRWPITDGRAGAPESWLSSPTRRVKAVGELVAAVSEFKLHLMRRDGSRHVAGPFDGLDRISIAPDGRTLAVGSWSGAGVRFFSGADAALLDHRLADEPHVIPTWSPDGRSLALCTRDRVLVVATGTFAPLFEVARADAPRPPDPCAFSPAGELLALNVEPRSIRLVRTDTWETVANLAAAEPVQIADLRFVREGMALLVATGSEHLHEWALDRLWRDLVLRRLAELDALPPGVLRERVAALTERSR